jgi:hypothetical protein
VLVFLIRKMMNNKDMREGGNVVESRMETRFLWRFVVFESCASFI